MTRVSEAQLPLVAHARADDPESSWVAARSVRNLTQTHERVLACLIAGKATDAEIIARYRDYYPEAHDTDQSIRSRRAELTKAGLVAWTGDYGKSENGGKARKWGRV